MSITKSQKKYNQKKPVIGFRVDKKLRDKLLSLADGKPLQVFIKEIVIDYLKIKGILEIEYKFKD